MMIDYSIHKGSFLNFIAPNNFYKIQTIPHTVIFHIGGLECPKHSGGDSLPLLWHCRHPMESQPSPRNIKILKNWRQLHFAANFSQRKWAHKTEIPQERWHIAQAENNRRFIRVFECYSLNSILDYTKIGKMLPTCVLILQNMIPKRALRAISYDNRQVLLCF